MRKRYDAQFKARVALEAIRRDRTLAEIARAYQVHPNQITKWRRQVLEELPKVLSGTKERGSGLRPQRRTTRAAGVAVQPL